MRYRFYVVISHTWIIPINYIGYLTVNMPSIIDFTGFYTLIENWCRNTQSVRNKVIHKNYVFSVTSRSRTFRFGRNKELVLTNKQKQCCKNLLFLRDTREKCFLRYREPATPGYVPYFFFMNSATCIFSGLYAVYVLDLHWQQSFVYITNVYFKQWPGEFRVIFGVKKCA
jgi:hypothetical protein